MINEEGLAKASIAKVARRMDTYPSLIQHYFGSRENLILELIDALAVGYAEFYHARIDQIQDPDERDRAIIDLIFSHEWDQLYGPLVYLELFSMGLRDKKIRQGVLRFNERLRVRLRADLSVFKLISGRDADLLLHHISFLMDGFHMWGFDRSPKEQRAAEEQQKRLVMGLLESAAERREVEA